MPNQRNALKSALKGTTALAGLLGLTVFGTTPALATCDNLAPTTGQTVICTAAGGTETNSIVAGNNVTDVTVIYEAAAAQSVAAAFALEFGQNNVGHTVALQNGASVATTGDNSGAVFFQPNSQNNSVTLDDGTTITTDGRASHGISAGSQASGNTVTLNGTASVLTSGDVGRGIFFINAPSSNRIILNNSSRIATQGSNSSGIYMGVVAPGNTITLNDASAIITVGGHAPGMMLGNASSNTSVTLNGSSSISTAGLYAHGLYFLDGAQTATVTLNDSASIATTGSARGVEFYLAQSNDVTLNDNSSISAVGNFGNGIWFGSVSSDNTVNLNGAASVTTNGADGISFSGTPTGNSVTLNGTASITTGGDNVSGVFFNNNGGTANTVTVGAGTSITTTGTNSIAIRDGDGSLTVVSAGLLSSASGVAVDLGDGDDSLTLQDGAQVVGLVDGGGGTDTLVLEGSTGFLDINHINFENLTVQAALNGAWDVTTDLVLTGNANVNQGSLSVNANFTAPTVAVAAGATLGGSGTINSAVTIGGTLAPGNSVGTLNVVGNFAFGAGAIYDVEVDRTGMDLLAVTGAPGTVTIDPATTVNVIHLDRAEGHAGDIVTATGGITGSFGTLSTAASPANSIAATLVQSATSIRLVTAAPSVFSSQVWAGSEEGFAFQDMLSDEAGASRTRTDRKGWTAAVYRDAERSRSRTIQPFDQNLHGTALGTDLYREGPVRVGAAVGYTGSEVELGSATGEGDFDSIHGGLYGSYHRGGYFLDGTVTGGYQDGDGERVVIVDGATMKAKADSGGYLVGTSVRTGWTLPLGGGWWARPSVGFSYMHRHQDRYSERGAGDAGVSLDSENSDAARMNWQLQVARASTVNLGGTSIALRSSARLGLMRECALDDRNIQGRFQADGSPFSLHMDARDETLATFGAGIDATFDGWTLFAAYDGAASQITDRNTVTAGIRKAW